MKIYIAGKISGEKTHECTMKFGTIQQAIEKLDHEAVNPLEVCMGVDMTWADAMRKDIKALMDCDGIYLLPDWKTSKGALIEQALALNLDMFIFTDISQLVKHNKKAGKKLKVVK